VKGANEATRSDSELVPVAWPDHSVAWIPKDQLSHYRDGLRAGLLIVAACAVLPLSCMIFMMFCVVTP
jgi:hypothetical protein